MNTKLLRKVAKHISEEPRRLNMDLVSRSADPEFPRNPPCGTIACIAGWTCVLSGLHETSATMNRAANLLNIDYLQSDRLFDPPTGRMCDGWPISFSRRYLRAKTAKGRAKIAVERIEHFIKTKGRE